MYICYVDSDPPTIRETNPIIVEMGEQYCESSDVSKIRILMTGYQLPLSIGQQSI